MRTIDRGKTAITDLMNVTTFVIFPTFLEALMTCLLLMISYGVWYSVITFLTIIVYVIFTISVTQVKKKREKKQ